jgi:hypothetical protein
MMKIFINPKTSENNCTRDQDRRLDLGGNGPVQEDGNWGKGW